MASAVKCRGDLLDDVDADGNTLMCDAASAGQAEAVEQLLRRGADPLLAGPGGPPLLLATGKKHVDVVDRLLDWHRDEGADVGINAADHEGRTPLFESVYCGIDVMRRLLAAGADPNICNTNGWSPLMLASGYRNTSGEEAVELLLAHGADVNRKTDEQIAALHLACMRNNCGTVTALLRRGADTEALSEHGNTALIYACTNVDAIDVVRLLLDAGAQVEGRGGSGWTPLHVASENGNIEVISELLARGACSDAVTVSNATPLCLAVIKRAAPAVRALLEAPSVPSALSPLTREDWCFLFNCEREARREARSKAEAALRDERAAHVATQDAFRFAIPHMLAACSSSSLSTTPGRRAPKRRRLLEEAGDPYAVETTTTSDEVPS